MRLTDVIVEAILSVRSSPFRNTLIVLISASLCAAGLATIGGSIADLTTRRAQFDSGGGSLFVLQADGVVSGRSCDRLSTISGIVRAGAISKTEETVVSAALPSQNIPIYVASEGFGDFTAVPGIGRRSSLFISEQLEEALRPERQRLKLDGGEELTYDASFAWPSDGRAPGLGFSVVERRKRVQSFDECWIQVGPGSEDRARFIGAAIGPTRGPDDKLSVSQLNASFGRQGPNAASLDHHFSRFTPLAISVVGLSLGLAFGWGRRRDVASDRHAGATLFTVLQIRTIELVGLFLVCLVAVLGGSSVLRGLSMLPNWYISTATIISYVGAFSLGNLLTVCLVRESMLFRLSRH